MSFFGWISTLVQTHRGRLLAVAHREGISGEDALDCTQEAFMGFLEMPQARSLAGDNDGAGNVLAAITRNTARNMRRRHHRARPHSAEPVDLLSIEDTASAEELVALAEQHTILVGCITQLRRVQRSVVQLRMFDGLAGDKVAALLGLTAPHVAVLLHRAKATLRDCMERAEADMGPGGEDPPG